LRTGLALTTGDVEVRVKQQSVCRRNGVGYGAEDVLPVFPLAKLVAVKRLLDGCGLGTARTVSVYCERESQCERLFESLE
jgi:hypothetical protein